MDESADGAMEGGSARGQPADGAPSKHAIEAGSSLEERRTRTLKHDDTFGVFDANGDILSGADKPDGIYHDDTRFLSHLHLTLCGLRPMLLSSTVRDDNAGLTCDLTNPDIHGGDDDAALIANDRIHLRRSRFLWDGRCFEMLAVRNFDGEPHRLRLEIGFAADFADLFEVRGEHRERRGRDLPPQVSGVDVVLAYDGLDDRRRETRLRFHPQPDELSADRAVYRLALGPCERGRIFLSVACDKGAPEAPLQNEFSGALRELRRDIRRRRARGCSIATSNEILNEAVRRSVADLHMLTTRTPEGPYPYAGIPWFSTVFGRDGIVTALETLWLDPSIARGVLHYLADHQATECDAAADAEPGKILHEVRHGEMAELGEVPFGLYYGTIDATPLFLMLAGAYYRRTGDLATVRAIWPRIEAALAWIDAYGDSDGDGFVEYDRQTDQGLSNQGWKDSDDSIMHADGTLARGPIALVEVQGYVHAAWHAAADIAEALGHPDRAGSLRGRADTLRRRFDEAFFDEELGTYVLALDGDKKPCRVRASNAGHALFAGIAFPERAPAVVRTLMDGRSFSGWGIRTLATREPRYNPMSYHDGSVWPHDNALIAAGFARYGFRREAARIFEGLFSAAASIDVRRLPELFCGFPRQRGRGPTFYPVACSPQAWAAVAPLYLIQSCLGLDFDPAGRRILFDRPMLPGFVDEIVLGNLAVGEARADIALRRSGSQVLVEVTDRTGPVRVITTS
jgi:glycogen debranching enzyme